MAKTTNRAPVLESWEPVVRALESCGKGQCADCPYEYGKADCDNILDIAAATIRELANEKARARKTLMEEFCRDYCEEKRCAECSVGRRKEDDEWRRR